MMSSLNHDETINDFFYNIPDEILAEILKTLPVKSLLRCMCIRKSWYRLIKSPTFINLHLNYHHQNTTTTTHTNDLPKYLFFKLDSFSKLLCLRYDDEHCEEFLELELPSVIRPGDFDWQATSCGLICVSFVDDLYGYKSKIYVWNPLIQKCKTLPVLDLSHIFEKYWTALAFGYVPSINDFQVVRIVSYGSKTSPSFLICVYSLNTNSWKTQTIREDILVGLCDKMESVSVNGISCWRVSEKLDTVKTDKVLYFDTLNDRLRTIPLPQVGKGISLLQFDQSVAVFVQDKFNVLNGWILKQDSISDFRWEKKVSVSLSKYLANALFLGLRNNSELILLTSIEPNLVSYNPESGEVKDFFKSWKDWTTLGPRDLFYIPPSFTVNPFVAGLVLLDTD